MDKGHTLLKFIIIGDSGTGKSCLLHRFTDNHYTDDQAQTIGVEFGAKVVNIMGRKVKLQIWDTAGQERYRSVTRSYYRGAIGCLLVYDVTRRESFEHVQSWLQDARQLAEKNVTIMMVGNKTDLAARREVSFTEASLYAQKHEVQSIETSACTGENVEEAFMTAAKNALQAKIEAGPSNSSEGGIGLKDSGEGEKSGCPC